MVSRRTSRKRKFNELLLEAIDEALSSLGESSKTAIYDRLETAFNIRKQEIPNRINDFSRDLEILFGLGARRLEIMFMKSLYVKVSDFECVSYEHAVPKVTFRDYVRFMRQNFEEAKQPEKEMRILTNEHEELQCPL